MPQLFFVFDVESIGLHGEGFAVGWVCVDAFGNEHSAGLLACPPEETNGDGTATQAEDRAWVAANVPEFVTTSRDPEVLRSDFCEEWARAAGWGAVMVTDCGWPVEHNFLTAIIHDNPAWRRAQPYPLHDVASVLLAAGMDPLKTYDRLPSELPRHNPLADARQSARLLIEALRATGAQQEGGG